ncbi:MAG: Eco57I restriction-modification methylase domain-containing protein [Melioribacteraceae bacterium]|nr:Eco57I restriction-modification methylase domain-containing protein [Melioribacteraceae bacterium]
MYFIETKDDLTQKADLIKYSYLKNNSVDRRKKYSQFFTPSIVAEFMASLISLDKPYIRILDPGAGTGILSVAVIESILNSSKHINKIELVVVEIDTTLEDHLKKSFDICATKCEEKNIDFSYSIINEDFIEFGYSQIIGKSNSTFFEDSLIPTDFDLIILNPPYQKIQSVSNSRKLLSKIGIETSNLYTAFLSICGELLNSSGQIIAITPRSFCNGTYFKKFREYFFRKFYFHRIHIYNQRNRAFNEDDVLQENIIFSVSDSKPHHNKVLVTTSESPEDTFFKTIEVDHNSIILPSDKTKIIHVINDNYSLNIVKRISSLENKLVDINMGVSTGRVVDFRAAPQLADIADRANAPLLYPFHFSNGKIIYPHKSEKKKEAIKINSNTSNLLVRSGFYVFCKRFSSKEEKKRIVAAVFNPDEYEFDQIGIENHLNYFHSHNNPLTKYIAYGLALYLNSTIVDQYFRLFNGHTQVNAEDLRYLPYPTIQQLEKLGIYSFNKSLSQEEIDLIIEKELFNMASGENPTSINKKINEALEILKQFGLPKDQQNERSALTLLALLNLKPDQNWASAESPMIGITPIMDFIKEFYGKEYAANTRESIRRQTMHQFVQAGLVIPNPDEPNRPTNSPKYVYQMEESALKIIKEYSTEAWEVSLSKYLSTVKTLIARYAQEREGKRIPLKISEKVEIYLSPGGQNELVEKIIKEFCPFFTPNANLIYVGDTETKWAYFNEDALKALNVEIEDQHGKMPDVIVHYTEKNWLVLIEAVTSHGPIDPKRKIELEELFANCNIGLVFITTFLDKKTMLQYLDKVAWETDIWVADNPTHLIHLNGKRFLGPYVKD